MNFYEVTFASVTANTSPILSNTNDPGDIVLTVISIFVLVSGVLSILFILWGGLLMILSGGKEEKITPALNTIRYAILGVVVTVVSIFVFPIFGRLLGFDVTPYAEPSKIFNRIKELGNNIFGGRTYSSIDVNQNNSELPSNFEEL